MDKLCGDGVGQRQTDSQEDSSQLKFPYCTVLPNEILEIVLSFVDAQDLLRWRTLSQSWNQITSRCLNMKRHSIHFHNSDEQYYHPTISDVKRILETMQNRKKGPFPFSHFKFYFYSNDDDDDDKYSSIWNTMLSQQMGSYMKSCSIHLDHFFGGPVTPVLRSILCHSPNLDTLYIYGQVDPLLENEALYFDSSLSVHPKLKHLIIMPYSPEVHWVATDSDHDGPMRMSVTELASCCKYFPELVVMKTGFNIDLVSGTGAEQFVEVVQKFDLLQLHLKIQDCQLLRRMCTQPLTNLHTLFLDMEPDLHHHPLPGTLQPDDPTVLSELIFKSLMALSPTLKRLKMKLYCVKYRIPMMISLEELELEYLSQADYNDYDADVQDDLEDFPIESLLVEQRLYPAQFPSLTRIHITCPGDRGHADVPEWAIFENNIFDTVEYLNVHGGGIPIPWNCFPNLKTSDIDLRSEYPKNKKILSIQELNTNNAFPDHYSELLKECYTKLGLIGSKYYYGRKKSTSDFLNRTELEAQI